MKPKDWLVIIIMMLGLSISAAGLALNTFESKDSNTKQHQIMLDWLVRIDAKLDKIRK